tara:strand:- start:110 stop:1228 length:1119 start_codon:yes stop_codon:yes gene_type:complete
MKKKIQQTANIFLISILLLISINFLLGWIWEIRAKYKFKDFEPYDEIVRKALNLNKQDALTLFLETHVTTRKYEYAPFLGHAENQGYNNKFVNVNPELGRKTISPTECKKNIFLYGGSTTFGAGVTDSQTIGSYLGQMLINDKKNICVKNYGRRSYFSFQETILFQKHILNEKIRSNDIIIFLDGINEYGNRKPRNTAILNQLYSISNQRYWDTQNIGFLIFLDSLTINQFFKRIKQKYTREVIYEPKNNYSKDYFKNIKVILEKNIVFRNSICKNYELNCYNFLQPFATIHGMYFEKQILGVNKNFVGDKDQINLLKKRWDVLKEVKGITNISDALKNSKKLGYVDRVHYSPYANKMIAEKIYNLVKNDFN